MTLYIVHSAHAQMCAGKGRQLIRSLKAHSAANLEFVEELLNQAACVHSGWVIHSTLVSG